MTTQTLTLTDFLLARIAEDEEQFAMADRLGVPIMRGSRLFSGIGNHPTATDGRLRAECDAKRRIVALHEDAVRQDAECPAWDNETGWVTDARLEVTTATLRALALPYADHPDYREEWKP